MVQIFYLQHGLICSNRITVVSSGDATHGYRCMACTCVINRWVRERCFITVSMVVYVVNDSSVCAVPNLVLVVKMP